MDEMKFALVLKRMLLTLGVLLLSALTGCGGVPVAQDLSQKQANEIVAVLNQSGISAEAEKETGGAGRYRVEVRRSFYSEAIALLHQRNLPGEEPLSFNQLIAQRGLIPGSREHEALRLERALGAEMEEALMQLPAVASARVIVRRGGTSQNFGPAEQQSAVAVVVVEKPGLQLDSEEVRQLVLRATPGVSPDKVSVFKYQKMADDRPARANEGLQNAGDSVVRVPLTQFLWVWRVPEDEYNTLAVALCAGMILILLLGGLLGFLSAGMRAGRSLERSLNPLAVAPRLAARNSKRVQEKMSDEESP